MTCAGEEGARQGELVNWYLGEIEGDIDSVEMLAEKKVLVEKVIERLVQHVSPDWRTGFSSFATKF